MTINQTDLAAHCERAAETLRPLEQRARLEMLKAQQERARPLDQVMITLGEELPPRSNGGCAGSHW